MHPLSPWRRRLATALGMLGTACGSGGSGPVSPDAILPTLSVTVETPNVAFRLSPGDAVEADWQEQYHLWATERLGVSLPGRVQCFKYADEAQMRSLTGRGCCFAEPDRLSIHTVSPRDNHEVVHVYSAQIGTPSNFFNEGLAVAFQTNPPAGDFEPRWNGTHLHTLARSLLMQERLPPLRNMVETGDFRRLSAEIGYTLAGSFTTYLIEEHGLEGVRRIFRGGRGPTESREQIEANVRAAFGRGLGEAEAGWHARLRAWAGGG